MRRGMVLVLGERTDGTVGEIDVLDLDDESFRFWLVETMVRGNVIADHPAHTLDLGAAVPPVYRQRITPEHPRQRTAKAGD